MKPLSPSTELLGSSLIEIHYQRPRFHEMYHVSCAEDAVTFLKNHINVKQLDLRECFWVVLLTNANRVLAISQVASGTTRGVHMNPMYIFQLALLTNASAMILAHNHPSGTLSISASDKQSTENIQQLGKLMEITLLDHIIITSESYLSFAQEGKL